jgi:hypothetical protein
MWICCCSISQSIHPKPKKKKKKNGRNYRAIEDFGSSLFSPSLSSLHGLTHKGRKEEAGCMTRLECFTVLQEKKRLDIEKEKDGRKHCAYIVETD